MCSGTARRGSTRSCSPRPGGPLERACAGVGVRDPLGGFRPAVAPPPLAPLASRPAALPPLALPALRLPPLLPPRSAGLVPAAAVLPLLLAGTLLGLAVLP